MTRACLRLHSFSNLPRWTPGLDARIPESHPVTRESFTGAATRKCHAKDQRCKMAKI